MRGALIIFPLIIFCVDKFVLLVYDVSVSHIYDFLTIFHGANDVALFSYDAVVFHLR